MARDYFSLSQEKAKKGTSNSSKRVKEEKATSPSSRSKTHYFDLVGRMQMERKIGFDTLQSDMDKVYSDYSSAFDTWQTGESLSNIKSSIEAMQDRVKLYSQYTQLYGTDDDYQNAVKNQSSWEKMLKSLDSRGEYLSSFKDENAYNAEQKRIQFDKDFAGLSYDEVQAKLKQYGSATDEHKYLSNYTGYKSSDDFLKAIKSASSDEHKSELEKAKNIYELDHAGDSYLAMKEWAGFDEKSKYVPTEGNKNLFGYTYYDDNLYEYINNADRRAEIDAYENSNKALAGNGNIGATSYQERNLDQMKDEERAIFNYLYQSDPNSAYMYLSEIQKMLDKRATDGVADTMNEIMNEIPVASSFFSLMTPVMSMAGGISDMGDVVSSTLFGAEYNPYDSDHGVTNLRDVIREKRGEQLAEGGAELPVIGNVNSFLYNAGMSRADSILGAWTMGTASTVIMGTSAYQQRAKELTEQGASDTEIRLGALSHGASEWFWEKYGLGKLLKTKNSDSLASVLKNVLKQSGEEAFGEGMTEFSNIISDIVIRGESSDYAKIYQGYIDRGFSSMEAFGHTLEDGASQILQSSLAGALSGGGMSAVYSGAQHHKLNKTGEQIRANNRVDDLIDLTNPENGLTQSESELYNLYGEYASKGINADNISNAQLGNIYATAMREADATIKSDKATLSQKTDAESMQKGLAKVGTFKAVNKSTGEAVNVKGVKTVDGETILVTDKGEISASEVVTTDNYAKMNELAKDMPEAMKSAFVSNYDGSSDVEAYKMAFDLAYETGQMQAGVDIAINSSRFLSKAQAEAIYDAGRNVTVGLRQEEVNKLVAEYSSNKYIKGKVDSKEIEGLKLTKAQQENVAVMNALYTGLGIDMQWTTIGEEKDYDGYYDPKTNTIVMDVYAGTSKKGVKDLDLAIVATASHELTHWGEKKAPEAWANLADHVFDSLIESGYGKNLTKSDIIAEEKRRIANDENNKYESAEDVPDNIAISEIVARGCEEMLSMSDLGKDIISKLSENEKKTIFDKVKEIFTDMINFIKDVLGRYKSTSREAIALRDNKERLEKQLKLWEQMMREAMVTNQSMKSAGIKDKDLAPTGADTMFKARDSEGRQLSEGQIEYFKDSKVRDENGNLKVMYHGTSTDFTVFNPVAYGGKNGIAEGYGIYFADTNEVSDAYGGKLMTGYLNITRPASSDKKTIKRSELEKLIKATSEAEAKRIADDEGYDTINDALRDTWVSNYVYTYDKSMSQAYKEVAESILSMNDNDMDIVQEVMTGLAIRNYDRAYEFYDILKDTLGIDGFLTEWESENISGGNAQIAVAFDSNQFKDIGNLNPTDSEDILFKSRRLAPTFYSHMSNVVADIKQAKLGADSVIPYLKGKGVKSEEIKWSGIEEFLEGKKSVTKAELEEFVAGSMLQIEEETLGEEVDTEKLKKMVTNYLGIGLAEYTIESTGDLVIPEIKQKVEEYYANGSISEDEYRELTKEMSKADSEDSKWHEYKLDGGENYRELLFKMPNSDYINQAMGTHWGRGGILAHARLQDFDTDNGKMLFIEEIQSDWHNAGQKSGYADAKNKGFSELIVGEYKMQSNNFPMAEVNDKFGNTYAYIVKANGFYVVELANGIYFDNFLSEEDALSSLEKTAKSNNGIPDAPFRNNYHEYVLKRLIRMASEEGYDSIGWTTGNIQEDRWSSEYAEGYRIEYDQDIPKFLRKYGKKWGATVGKTDIQTKHLSMEQEADLYFMADGLEDSEGFIRKEKGLKEVWQMTITDAMRDSVLHEGQVMYKRRDSKGTQLTPEQVEYFEDSKVRDGKGSLKVVYHGTTNNFTTFRRGDIGYHFGNKSTAQNRVGRGKGTVLMECYLNITNPIVFDVDLGSWDADYRLAQELYEMEVITREEGLDVLFNREKQYKRSTGDSNKRLRDLLISKGYDGIIYNNTFESSGSKSYIVFNSNQAKLITNTNPTEDADIRYKKRDASIYDVMGESENLQKQNEILKADAERYKERLKLESKVTNGRVLDENKLIATAKHLRNLAKSEYSEANIAEALREMHTKNFLWDDLMAKCYELAQNVLKDSKGYKVTNEYFKSVLADIRKARITLNDEQIQEAKSAFGENYRNAFMGRIMLVKDGTSLDQKWSEWSSMYPEIFDADLSPADQITALSDIYDSLRDGAEMYQKLNDEESIRAFAMEIYNKYWHLSTIRTIADKYDEKIKKLNFEHRKAMQELRNYYNNRLENQKKADAEYYGKIIRDLRNQRDERVKEAKELGRQRVNAVRDNVTKKNMVARIKKNIKILKEHLLKNSKDKHINEELKPMVRALVDAIDLEVKKSDVVAMEKAGADLSPTMAEELTLKDYQEAVANVRDNMKLLNALYKVKDSLDTAEFYGMGIEAEVESLVTYLEELRDINQYPRMVLNAMSIDQLNTVDKLVSGVKSVVMQANRLHEKRRHMEADTIGSEVTNFLDTLGKGKEYKESVEKYVKTFKWKNLVPYYAFKRLGKGGKVMFEILQDGWDKLAFNIRQILEFTDGEDGKGGAYTKDEVKKWNKEVKDIVIGGKKYKMTVPQIMSLYCLNKREQGRKHIYGFGIRVGTFDSGIEVVNQTEDILVTEDDVNAILSLLTSRQKEVAEKIQEFMNRVCTEWGNYVSMERFGYKAFGEENYFPIEVDDNNLIKNKIKENQNTSLYALLNMGFSKSLNDNAKNAIIVNNIFDVFANHASEMAKYNALGLAVLDFNRIMNFSTDRNGSPYSLKTAMETAFGKDAEMYFNKLIADLNGTQNVSRDVIGKGAMAKAKLGAIGWNIKTILLQPTAYFKAIAVIDKRYLFSPVVLPLVKRGIERSKKYCGMALWKSLGFYDTNISRGVVDKIKHEESLMDILAEKSTKGMEKADAFTIGLLWNACELEMTSKRKDLKDDAFYEAVANRLREVIYATQVVDSTLTRSEMMRSGDGKDKMLTAFMSEPTLSYNMLLDAVMETSLLKRSGASKEALQNNRRKVARVLDAYIATNIVTAVFEAFISAFRDEDELEEGELEKMMLENFVMNMGVIGKIPYLKDVVSLASGYSPSRIDLQGVQSLVYAFNSLQKNLKGEGNVATTIKHSLKGFSSLSGLAFFNAYRDIMALLDFAGILSAEELEELLNEIIE